MTGSGETRDQGTIFSIDTLGNSFKNIVWFNDSDGANPF